jgi:hypothetical protein
MSFDNNNSSVFGDSNVGSFENNIGRIITVFTESGGASGSGFTGLLVHSDCNFIKLITCLPSAPPCPFGNNDFSRRRRGFRFDRELGNCCCNTEARFGTVIVIPVDQIVAFVFNEI